MAGVILVGYVDLGGRGPRGRDGELVLEALALPRAVAGGLGENTPEPRHEARRDRIDLRVHACQRGDAVGRHIAGRCVQVGVQGEAIHAAAGNGRDVRPRLHMGAGRRVVGAGRARRVDWVAVDELASGSGHGDEHRRQHLEPLPPGKHAHLQLHRAAGEAQRQWPRFDTRLERDTVVERLGAAVDRAIGVELRARDLDADIDRRTRVVAEKLTHLPLARQHPQRVADLGGQCAIEALDARSPLQAVPDRDARQRAAGDDLGDVRRDHLDHLSHPLRARSCC